MILYQPASIGGSDFQIIGLALVVAVLAAYALWFAVDWRDLQLSRVRREQVIVVGAILGLSILAIIGCVWSCTCDWTNLWCAI